MLLLVDVRDPHRSAFSRWGTRKGWEVVAAGGGDLRSEIETTPALCVLQACGDGAVQRVRVQRIQQAVRRAPLVVLADNLSTDVVVRLVRESASHVIGLPCDPEEAVVRASEIALDGESPEAEELIGRSPAIRMVRSAIEAVATMPSTVLLTGETGVGKGVAARAIHRLSDRRHEPFVHLDCSTVSSSLVESELFGHERGAFTGAVGRRAGRFELAKGGTIFLDEIGEMSLELQSKLLRVLQDRTFERIGGRATLHMAARVIAATNRDLEDEIRAGRFRADLFFRLNVIEIPIPPLRDRLEDLPCLVHTGIRHLCAQLSLPRPRIEPAFYDGLARCEWPGNVRQLMNLLERLLVCHRAWSFDAACLEQAVGSAQAFHRPPDIRAVDSEARCEIAAALQSSGGNVSRAARRLGIPRSTLRHRIRHHRLEHLIPVD